MTDGSGGRRISGMLAGPVGADAALSPASHRPPARSVRGVAQSGWKRAWKNRRYLGS